MTDFTFTEAPPEAPPAIDVLDEAGARVKLGKTSSYADIKRLERDLRRAVEPEQDPQFAGPQRLAHDLSRTVDHRRPD